MYVVYLTRFNYGFGRTKRLITGFPAVVMLVMGLLNPFTKWIFYYDEFRIYHRSMGMVIPYIISTVYYIASMVMILFFWQLLNRKRKIVMIYFFAVISAGILIQLLLAPAHTELLMEALGLTGLMVTIGNEEDLMDPRSHVYNHEALEYDLNVFRKV